MTASILAVAALTGRPRGGRARRRALTFYAGLLAVLVQHWMTEQECKTARLQGLASGPVNAQGNPPAID